MKETDKQLINKFPVLGKLEKNIEEELNEYILKEEMKNKINHNSPKKEATTPPPTRKISESPLLGRSAFFSPPSSPSLNSKNRERIVRTKTSVNSKTLTSPLNSNTFDLSSKYPKLKLKNLKSSVLSNSPSHSFYLASPTTYIQLEEIKVSEEQKDVKIQTNWDTVFTFSSSIPLPMGCKKKKFNVSLDFNKTINMGELNELEVTIDLLPQNPYKMEGLEILEDSSSTIKFQIETNNWLVVGYQDSTFVVSVSESKKIKYKLLPILCGNLPLPSFKIIENNDVHLFASSIFPNVTVVPKQTFITSTVIN